jgi:hypothetical protein
VVNTGMYGELFYMILQVCVAYMSLNNICLSRPVLAKPAGLVHLIHMLHASPLITIECAGMVAKACFIFTLCFRLLSGSTV